MKQSEKLEKAVTKTEAGQKRAAVETAAVSQQKQLVAETGVASQQKQSAVEIEVAQAPSTMSSEGEEAPVALAVKRVKDIESAQQENNVGLACLYDDVANLIFFEYLAPKDNKPPTDFSHLSQTCTFFYNKLQPTLNKEAIRLAHKLVQHVVLGEKNDVEAMLKANPGLLLWRATVTDYSGCIIEDVTAFEAALGAGDPDMAEMIAPYFDKLESVDGAEEHKRQYQRQFPNGVPDLQEQESYDFSLLVETITNSSEDELQAQLNHEERDSALCSVINAFRVDPCWAPRTITVGQMHFNHYKTLIRAIEIYNQRYDKWPRNKKKVFWRQVVSYTERFLLACDAQVFAQGLYDIVEENEPLQRSLKFKHEMGGSNILPVDSYLSFRLGFDWGVAALVGVRCELLERGGMLGEPLADETTWTDYVKQKHQRLQDLANHTCSRNLPGV